MTNRLPERWLRGPVAGIGAPLQPVAHALIAAREDVAAAVEGLTREEWWQRPAGSASVGFHVLHLAGSTERLFTYARGEALVEAQLAALARERTADDDRPDPDGLLRAWNEAVERALRQLADTRDAELAEGREVGRAKLPSTVLGLLFHAAEHAARHAGQIVTTARIVKAG